MLAFKQTKQTGTNTNSHLAFKLGLLLAVSILPTSLVNATSLQSAFEAAYENNPSLKAERERTKGVNESVREAIGQAFPTVSARLSSTFTYSYVHATHTDGGKPGFLASINLSQPLYRGGAISDGIQFVEYNTKAQWSRLRSLEQQVFGQVSQAYIGVLKDAALVEQYTKSVDVLSRQLEAANARFEVGEGTKTEIAQANTRVAQTNASLQNALATLNTRKATYRQLVGQNIGGVSAPRFPTGLPSSLDAAVEAALSFDPQLLAGVLTIRANEMTEELRKAAGRPQADLTASLTENVSDLEDFHDTRSKNFQIGATVTIPLYQGGRIKSQVAQARHTTRKSRYDLEATKGNLRQGATAAWNQLSNARALMKAFRTQQKAASLVLEGAELELEVGTKTFLDVLDAEMTLQEANIGMVRAGYDELAAAYALLAATGQLTARDLSLNVNYWDAEDHYNAIVETFDAVYKYIPALRF